MEKWNEKQVMRILKLWNDDDYEIVTHYENGCRCLRKNEWFYGEMFIEFHCSDLTIINADNYSYMSSVATMVLKRYK